MTHPNNLKLMEWVYNFIGCNLDFGTWRSNMKATKFKYLLSWACLLMWNAFAKIFAEPWLKKNFGTEKKTLHFSMSCNCNDVSDWFCMITPFQQDSSSWDEWGRTFRCGSVTQMQSEEQQALNIITVSFIKQFESRPDTFWNKIGQLNLASLVYNVIIPQCRCPGPKFAESDRSHFANERYVARDPVQINYTVPVRLKDGREVNIVTRSDFSNSLRKSTCFLRWRFALIIFNPVALFAAFWSGCSLKRFA